MNTDKTPKYESNIASSTGGNEKPAKVEVTPTEVKLGQIEVALGELKEKLDNERNLKFWIIGTVLAIATGIVGGMSFYHSITKDYLDSLYSIEDKYYEELIKSSVSSIKIESCSSATDYYWQFKNCLSK